MATTNQIKTISKQINTIFGVSHFPSDFIVHLGELNEIFSAASRSKIDHTLAMKIDDVKHIPSSAAAWIREKALADANGYVGIFKTLTDAYDEASVKVDTIQEILHKSIGWSKQILIDEDVKDWLQEKTTDIEVGGVHFRIWAVWTLIACGLITGTSRTLSHILNKKKSSQEVVLFDEEEINILKDHEDTLDAIRHILAFANDQCSNFISSWEEMPEDLGKKSYSQTAALLIIGLISMMTILVFDWILVEGATN